MFRRGIYAYLLKKNLVGCHILSIRTYHPVAQNIFFMWNCENIGIFALILHIVHNFKT